MTWIVPLVALWVAILIWWSALARGERAIRAARERARRTRELEARADEYRRLFGERP